MNTEKQGGISLKKQVETGQSLLKKSSDTSKKKNSCENIEKCDNFKEVWNKT